MIWWTGLAPWEFEFPFRGSLASAFLAGVLRPVYAGPHLNSRLGVQKKMGSRLPCVKCPENSLGGVGEIQPGIACGIQPRLSECT